VPNPKRYKPTVTRIVLPGMIVYLRDVLHVQHLSIRPDESGLLQISANYMVGVEQAYQVWAHAAPGDPGSVYIGVVFKLKDTSQEWCAVEANGQFWSSFATTRRGAIEYLQGRFFQ
jgi:hypothetical protein